MSLNLDKAIDQLLKAQLLNEQIIKEICEQLKQILIDESNIVSLQSPVSVCGDIHGQFYDLLEIFKVGGKPPDVSYLFLGNLVDRGHFSVETLSLILCLKLRFPSRVTILRGNHESAPLTKIYGFYSECIRKYGNANVWKYFTEVFNYFTVAAIIDEKVFCVHGGLSPLITSLDQIRVLDRFRDIPEEGALTDILWSDPNPEKEGFITGRDQRGAGCAFGKDVVSKFLTTNKLDHIVRGHQLCMDGYQVSCNGCVSTIWSAPNFCGKCGNVGCILEFRENLDKFYNCFLACPESERKRPSIDTLKEIPDYYQFKKLEK